MANPEQLARQTIDALIAVSKAAGVIEAKKTGVKANVLFFDKRPAAIRS